MFQELVGFVACECRFMESFLGSVSLLAHEDLGQVNVWVLFFQLFHFLSQAFFLESSALVIAAGAGLAFNATFDDVAGEGAELL